MTRDCGKQESLSVLAPLLASYDSLSANLTDEILKNHDFKCIYIFFFFYNFSSSFSFFECEIEVTVIFFRSAYIRLCSPGSLVLFLIHNRERERERLVRLFGVFGVYSFSRLDLGYDRDVVVVVVVVVDRDPDLDRAVAGYYSRSSRKARKTDLVENFFFPFVTLIQTRKHGIRCDFTPGILRVVCDESLFEKDCVTEYTAIEPHSKLL